MPTIIDYALKYMKLGYSVIPLSYEKKPLLKSWLPYQKKRAAAKQIREWWKQFPNAQIGIVTGEVSDLFVIDVDSQSAMDKLEDITPELAEFPISLTTSGGQHRWFKYSKGLRNLAGVIDGLDVRGEGGYIVAPPSECYKKPVEKKILGAKYKFLSGCSITDIKKTVLIKEYKQLIKERNNNDKESEIYEPKGKDIVRVKFTKGYRDNALYYGANYLSKAGMPAYNVKKFITQLAKSCDPPFSESEIEAKVLSAMSRVNRTESGLYDEVVEWIEMADGTFFSRDIANDLVIISRPSKQNLSKVLGKLVEEGAIERHGGRNGCFRKPEIECPEIEWMEATGESIPIQWPLNIHRYYRTMPKNVILVAGSPDAGKTAFLLNFVAMNMMQYKINYFSSEMGANELKDRLRNFEGIRLNDWKFKAMERSENFADVIVPDEINVIDFLEINDAFYLVAAKIKAIFDKLTTGIAVIAIQKNVGAEDGRGGSFGKEKARLYVTLDPKYPGTVAKISKCKNWVNSSINPNGLECEYKLHGGANIQLTSEWARGVQKDGNKDR